MDYEHREKLRAAAQRRGRCPNCQGPVRVTEIDDAVHFAGIKYKVCDGCGWEQPQTSKRDKVKL